MTTPERIRYWFNRETGLIHKSSCTNCLMTYNGHEKNWGDVQTRSNWWGPYQTVGAALDAGLSTGHAVHLRRLGCGEWPQINPT